MDVHAGQSSKAGGEFLHRTALVRKSFSARLGEDCFVAVIAEIRSGQAGEELRGSQLHSGEATEGEAELGGQAG